MNIKTLIQEELWQEISKSYEAENYKNSILDAMHFLSELLRAKTGLDSDGTSLVGQALGGDSPRIKINKLQTTSEKDEQRGFIQLLNGLYTAIRNPRSHERIVDTKNTADPIIFFINYLCWVIDKSKSSFMLNEFLDKVFDINFVENEKYSILLANEIPETKITDVLIEIFRRRRSGKPQNILIISREIIRRLSEPEIDLFLSAVSYEMDLTHDEVEIYSALSILPINYWPRFKETTKMRIENILIKSIRMGKCKLNNQQIISGELGTLARGRSLFFTLDSELKQELKNKLLSEDIREIFYVILVFLDDLPILFDDKRSIRITAISLHKLTVGGSLGIRQIIRNFLDRCPSEWRKVILEIFSDLTDPKKPEFWLDDLTPFLGKLPKEDDDLPF